MRIALRFGTGKTFCRHPFEIGSEKFNLGIESFRQGIGRTVVVEVQNLIVMFVGGSSNDIERMQSSLFDLVVPPRHIQTCCAFDRAFVENSPDLRKAYRLSQHLRAIFSTTLVLLIPYMQYRLLVYDTASMFFLILMQTLSEYMTAQEVH